MTSGDPAPHAVPSYPAACLRTQEEIAARARSLEHVSFAWMKALDHRGISAGRSVEKLAEWLWVLGDDRGLYLFESAPYPQYGCPRLLVLSERYGAQVPGSEDARLMSAGLPCTAGGGCGCGE